MNKICTPTRKLGAYTAPVIVEFYPFHTLRSYKRHYGGHPYKSRIRQRRRVKCPDCGRKIFAQTKLSDDGDLVFLIPPHKIKGWWKKSAK